jgi:hypothetical protein
MAEQALSPLRRRRIEDMTIRKFTDKTQHDYVRRVKDFASFLKRSPDPAKPEDVRGFQLHLGVWASFPTFGKNRVRVQLIEIGISPGVSKLMVRGVERTIRECTRSPCSTCHRLFKSRGDRGIGLGCDASSASARRAHYFITRPIFATSPRSLILIVLSARSCIAS